MRENQGETATITRTEAIQRAIDALGVSAPVPQILDYVWEHFGIGVPPKPAQPILRSPSPGETLPPVTETPRTNPTPESPQPLERAPEAVLPEHQEKEAPPSPEDETPAITPAHRSGTKRGKPKGKPTQE